MRERCVLERGEGCTWAAMFRMTMATTKPGIIMHQSPVDGCHILHLLCNFLMTGCTAIRHGRGFPGRGMTGFAVSSGLRVRGHASQGPVPLGIQKPRTVHG